MSNINSDNLDFDVLFANSVNREDIDEETYSKGWYSIVGGLNGIPTVRQFNAMQYISDLKSKYLYHNKLDKNGGKADDLVIDFLKAEKRENIVTGESLQEIMGKVNRYFNDLKNVAFTGKYSDLSNTPTTLKNPNTLSISADGTSLISYDGSEQKGINLIGGSNIDITTDSKGNITLDNMYSYTHPTTSGNKHIPTGGSEGKYLKWCANGTAAWATLLINNLTQSASGTYALDAHQGKVLKDMIDTNAADISTLHSNLEKMVPTNHASTGTGYGIGNANNYGHVKLSDAYKTSGGGAANAVGASSAAVFNTYNVMGTWQIVGFATVGVVTSSTIASGVAATLSKAFTAMAGATKYIPVLVRAGYCQPYEVSISGTTLTTTVRNWSNGPHTLVVEYLVIGVKSK